MELLDPKDLSFSPVDHDDHFVAHQFDMTNAIYEFQFLLLRQKWKLSIEDHIQYAMLWRAIQFYCYHQINIQTTCHRISPKAILKAAINNVKSSYGLNSPRMQIETVTNMISILQELDIEVISSSQASVKLLELYLLPNERKFANGLAELVKKFPRVPMAEDVCCIRK